MKEKIILAVLAASLFCLIYFFTKIMIAVIGTFAVIDYLVKFFDENLNDGGT